MKESASMKVLAKATAPPVSLEAAKTALPTPTCAATEAPIASAALDLSLKAARTGFGGILPVIFTNIYRQKPKGISIIEEKTGEEN